MASRPLDNAYMRVKAEYPTTKMLTPLRDSYGVYAYAITIDGRQYNLCLRRGAGYRGLISIHEELTRGKIPILLAFGVMLYVIYPQAIRNYYTHIERHRGALKYQFYLAEVAAREFSPVWANEINQKAEADLFDARDSSPGR